MTDSSAIPKSRVRFALCAICIWLALVVAYSAWAFFVPHDFTYGPEIGPTASFIFFVAAYSVPYFIVATILFVITFPLTRDDRDSGGT